MSDMKDLFLLTDKQIERHDTIEALIPRFKERAAELDEKAAFPFENFAELKEKGLTKIVVPKVFGGEEASLTDFLLVQEQVAQGDGATALSLGWHNGVIMQLRETEKWSQKNFITLSKEIVDKGVLINTIATEPATGSPARGGKPETTARPIEGGYEISGKKTFTSLAPILDYFIVTATVEPNGEIGEFLIPKNSEGLSIDETWNTMGMRATRSDDLILHRVKVDGDAWVAKRTPGSKPAIPHGWLLHVPACYIGIAKAARDEAVAFAKTYQPNSLDHPIKDVPEVRRKTAEMDLKMMQARHFMYSVSKMWDDYPEHRPNLSTELTAVKTTVTNMAIDIVDLAMRIVGGHSLAKSNPLERYYRDVRAGLHNPPSDDITMMALGNKAYDS
ncbi:acyl-CoA dehydrogenase family protein [Alteribacter aurantiacus]|uniref:acyl-CoA dehydrogenase family protein n=1 Tax=Alteribacter aurantiacus TaxID=254410 RepID=UPI000404BDC5|nr:acyl-CoA dehydrogenase family protein [Alteribacter aurantiacus]